MSAVIASAVLLTTAILVTSYSTSKHTRTPPGPKPLPLIGNLLDFPQEKPWIAFASWKERYGDISYINVLGTHMVVLNSMKACIDLLDNRSAKYSGRPRSIMLGELSGFDYAIPLMTYSARWRTYRRLFHQYFNERASLGYRPVQESNVHHFLQRLLSKPEELQDHARLMFGRTILDIVYDIKVEDSNNIFIQIAEIVVAIAAQSVVPGQFLVDVFPKLMHIPSWFPGGKFKLLATEWRKATVDLRDLAFNHVKQNMEKGTAGSSVLTSMLEKCGEGESAKEKTKLEEDPEYTARSCAALAYLGGADTTLSTIQAFFLVMANNPDVQKTAHIELEALLGSSPTRLPSFDDKPHLPFITAIAKELLRYHNVIPLGLPHVLTEDDEYEGYSIREGTVVFANIWRILHDPEIYPDPFTFNPRRWLIDTPEGLQLDPTIPDPEAVFGFGRRICPGRHFALNSLFVTIACVLTCFDVRPLDAEGNPTDKIQEESTNGLLIYPIPYKVAISVRSEELAKLVKDLEV